MRRAAAFTFPCTGASRHEACRHAGVQAAGEGEREREIHTQTDIQTYRYTDRVIPCIGAIGDESTHILVEAFAYAF